MAGWRLLQTGGQPVPRDGASPSKTPGNGVPGRGKGTNRGLHVPACLVTCCPLRKGTEAEVRPRRHVRVGKVPMGGLLSLHLNYASRTPKTLFLCRGKLTDGEERTASPVPPSWLHVGTPWSGWGGSCQTPLAYLCPGVLAGTNIWHCQQLVLFQHICFLELGPPHLRGLATCFPTT